MSAFAQEYPQKNQKINKEAEFGVKEVHDSVRELSMKIENLKTQINELMMDRFDESEEENRSYEDEEEFKPNPWIWSGSRRPRPVPNSYVQECQKNPPSNLKSMLKKVLVQDIAISNWVKKRPVLISAKQSIERALYKISAHGVHSLPVVDQNGEIFGIIDVEDLARPFIAILKDDPLTGVVRINNDVMGRPVSSLFLHQEKRSFLISNGVPVWNAMTQFIKTDMKRFLITDRVIEEEVRAQSFPENKIDGLFTQTDVFRFLSSNLTWMKLEPLFHKSLGSLHLGTRQPLVIPISEYAATAFSLLSAKKRTNAAIVDKEGKLLSNFSHSDFKGLTRQNSFVLDLTLEEFFKHDKKKTWWEKPSAIELGVPLMEVILQFNCTQRHVLYVLDKNCRPVGELNQRDVLTTLVQQL
jgi:CBS-domain-containing membrane protein